MSSGPGVAHRLHGPGGRRAILCMALLVALPGSAGAFDVDYEIGVAAIHSDNIALDDEAGTSDTVLAPRLRFALERQGSAATLQARGQVEYRDYLDDTFASEWRGELAGQFDWSIIPQRVSLVLEDYLSQQPVDLGVGLSPGNLQRVNVFVGGPSFHARLGDATRARLDLRAANSHAEESEDFNGDRYSAALRVQRELSPTQQASLNAVATRAEFDEAGEAADYSRVDAFVSYRHEYARGYAELDLGRSRLSPETDGSRVTATLARANLVWTPSARSRLHANARYQLADSTQDLILRQSDLSETGIPELVASTLPVNPDVYRQRRFNLDYRYRGDRFELRLRPRYRSHRYLRTALDDHEDYSGYAELAYRARPRLTLSLQATALNREFLVTQRKDRDRVYGIQADWLWTRHLTSQIGFHRNTRDSTAPGADYAENAISVALMWRR